MMFVFLPDLVHRPMGADAERVAVTSPAGELTYRQLWDQAAATASLLTQLGSGAGDPVGLYFHRSAEYVTSLLATLSIGAVAVPIDPELPVGRVEQLLAAAAPQVVLHAGASAPGAVASRALGWHDVRAGVAHGEGASVAYGESAGDPVAGSWRRRPAAEHPALILFTSGSTGQAKGVVLHHGGLVNRLSWGHDWFGFTGDDRVLHKASIGFDASLHEIFAPLIAGGTVVIAPPGLQFDSLGLVRLIRQAGVTTAHFVPTMLRHVLDEPELASCTDLRRVLCGGEALDMELVRRFRSILPCGLFNGYGPTETSINVTYWDCAEPHDGSIAPIGRPVAGVLTRVLGEDLESVPVGETGELWIGGIAVGLGYLDDDVRTLERFRPDPIDAAGGRLYRTGDLVRLAPAGYLEFRGRIDDQVKIRGIRVEPGEVSAVLRGHPAVHDAVVVVAADEARLVGYVVANPRESPVVCGFARLPLPNGLAITAPSPDEALFLYHQIFDHAEYSRFGVRLSDGAVVVDVGANIGLFSLWASRQAQDVRLIAIEPNPDTVPYLRANLSLYAAAAEIVEAAVTDRAGMAELMSFPELTYLSGLGSRQEAATDLVRSHYRRAGLIDGAGQVDGVGEAGFVDGAGPAGGAGFVDGTGIVAGTATGTEQAALLADARRRLRGVTHVVPTIALADLFDRLELSRIDVLKINAEGAELSILRGLRAEHWARIAQVCLEVEHSSVVGPQIRAMLDAAGFEVHEISDWNVGSEADVSYVYAVRASALPVAGTPSPAPADQLLTAGQLRAYLSSFLPAAMQPDQIVFLDRLPRLPNGKVARLELPAPPPRASATWADKLGTGLEDQLREVWRATLGVDAVRDDDNFFALGGHSLTALRVSGRVRETAGLEISPASCLRAGTFADWLGLIAGRGSEPERHPHQLG